MLKNKLETNRWDIWSDLSLFGMCAVVYTRLACSQCTDIQDKDKGVFYALLEESIIGNKSGRAHLLPSAEPPPP